MTLMTETALVAGLTGGLAFLILGIPLGYITSAVRTLLGDFGEKLVLAVFVGAFSAPVVAEHAPDLANEVVTTVNQVEEARAPLKTLADILD